MSERRWLAATLTCAVVAVGLVLWPISTGDSAWLRISPADGGQTGQTSTLNIWFGEASGSRAVPAAIARTTLAVPLFGLSLAFSGAWLGERDRRLGREQADTYLKRLGGIAGVGVAWYLAAVGSLGIMDLSDTNIAGGLLIFESISIGVAVLAGLAWRPWARWVVWVAGSLPALLVLTNWALRITNSQ